MWYKNIERHIMLKNIYTEIPKLMNVRIARMEIKDEGNDIAISFDMPIFADKVPIKWKGKGYNTVNVVIEFFGIREVSVTSIKNSYRGNIEIYKDDLDLISVRIEGTVSLKIQAEAGLIQSVEAYCNEP